MSRLGFWGSIKKYARFCYVDSQRLISNKLISPAVKLVLRDKYHSMPSCSDNGMYFSIPPSKSRPDVVIKAPITPPMSKLVIPAKLEMIPTKIFLMGALISEVIPAYQCVPPRKDKIIFA